MALNLEQYIRQSYKTPNPGVLKGLGADEELINYLKETPWNTNFNVLKNWTKEEDDGWTTIRLDAQYREEDEDYTLMSSNEEDINNFKQLAQLCQNDQHPIIKVSYDISEGNTRLYTNHGVATFIEEGLMIDLLFSANYTDDEGERESIECSVMAEVTQNNFIEIKYKIGDYYILNIDAGGPITSYNIEKGDSWMVPTLEGYQMSFTDGTNIYVSGDMVTPTSNMTVTIIEQQGS